MAKIIGRIDLIPGRNPEDYPPELVHVQEHYINLLPTEKILRLKVIGGVALYFIRDAEKGELLWLPYKRQLKANPEDIEKLTAKDLREHIKKNSRLFALLSSVVNPKEKKKKEGKNE